MKDEPVFEKEQNSASPDRGFGGYSEPWVSPRGQKTSSVRRKGVVIQNPDVTLVPSSGEAIVTKKRRRDQSPVPAAEQSPDIAHDEDVASHPNGMKEKKHPSIAYGGPISTGSGKRAEKLRYLPPHKKPQDAKVCPCSVKSISFWSFLKY